MQLFFAFFVALAITAVLIPVLARWAPSIGLTDRPGPRKVHAQPVPRVGGIAMAAGILAPALLTVEMTTPLRGLLIGLAVLVGFGVWDDRANLGSRTKFLGQIIAVAVCMIVGDVRLDVFETGNAPLTFLFLVGVTNAMNLSDGLDGLAGGTALLCFCALALLGAAGDNLVVTAVALIEAGAILGFLRFNTHPARVFMGDCGSQMLGFTMGVLAILATQTDRIAVSSALPLLLIGVPVLDTLAVMYQRIREGRSPFSSDRNHLHHKLLALGFAHAEAVSIIYVLQVALFLIAYFLRFESDVLIVSVFVLFSGALFGSLHLAAHLNWRVRHVPRPLAEAPLTRFPAWAAKIMLVSLLAYAVAVIAVTDQVGWDIGLLCFAVLILLAAAKAFRWLERAGLYVGVVLLVYLDQTAPVKPVWLSSLIWILLATAGVAALSRILLSSARRFEVTSLDLLVVFIALVMPNLPGLAQLPEALSAGVAKAVILLYVVEMLIAANVQQPLSRAFFALMLGAIAVRALIAV